MLRLASLSLLLSVGVGFLPMAVRPSWVQAQEQVLFTPPNAAQRRQDRKRWGRPTTRTPGGTRDRCAQQLIALVPSPEAAAPRLEICLEESVSDLAFTRTQTPILWFYIPQLSASRRAELVLLQDHREIHKQELTVPAQAGIVGFRLKQPLQSDQLYGWSFTLLTHPQSPSQNPTVEGLIRYRESQPAQPHLQSDAQTGIWHDALTALAQQHCQTNSQNWTRFLGSVGLDAIATHPILNCEVLSTSASLPVSH